VIRILVADDHAPTREEVVELLAADERFDVCAQAATAADAVAAAVRERPDVCLVDVNMPGSGIAAVWEIAARLPQARIVMFTVSDRDADLLAALRAGAHGYLLKDTDPRRLPQALAEAAAGSAALPRELMARVIEEFRERGPRRRPLAAGGERLTAREWEVLERLERGQSAAEIARELHIAPVTVRTHAAAVQRKLGSRPGGAQARR
jgi:DNA-binding NarL/FixJ family response regulator